MDRGPLPRRLGDFDLETIVADDDTGTTYRASRPNLLDVRVCLRLFAGAYVHDEAARLLLFTGLQDHPTLTHPNILEVTADGPLTLGGAIALPVRWVRGRGLSAVLAARGAMSWPAACAIALDVCQALAHAHARGVVHGDLRPEHCFVQDPLPAIGRERRALLTGFGVAAAYRTAFPRVAPDVVPDDATRAAFPPHMSPEQAARGCLPDVRSDIYGVAALIVHLVTGAPPRAVGWPPAIERVGGPADSYRDDADRPPVLPPAVEVELLRALSRDPAARHPTIDALVSALVAADEAAAETALARRPTSRAFDLPIDPLEPGSLAFLTGAGYVFFLLLSQCLSR